MRKKNGAIFYIFRTIIIVLGWVVSLACVFGKDAVENKTSLYIIGGVFGVLPIMLAAWSMIRRRKHREEKETEQSNDIKLSYQDLLHAQTQDDIENLDKSLAEYQVDDGILDLPSDLIQFCIEHSSEKAKAEKSNDNKDDIAYAHTAESEEEQSEDKESTIEQIDNNFDSKLDNTETAQPTTDNAEYSKESHIEESDESNEINSNDTCEGDIVEKFSDAAEIETEQNKDKAEPVHFEYKSEGYDSETMEKFIEFTSRLGRVEELIKAVNSLENSYKHFQVYINGKTKLSETVKADKVESISRKVINTVTASKESKIETPKESEESHDIDYSEDGDAGPFVIDVSEYRENLPLYEWIAEDKRNLKRPDDNNGEIWWNKKLVDKYRESNPEFEYENAFGRIFLNTVWYIDGDVADHAVLGFIHNIEEKGGRTYRELSSRCTHLLITESADETTFTKNMAKKYRLKPITIQEFKELVSIGDCTAEKNRHLFPPSKMFNITSNALAIEEEEDGRKYLFLHRYNDKGLIMTWLGEDKEKKTLIWSGDDLETFWTDYRKLLTDCVIVTPRPKKILDSFSARLAEIGQYASFKYIDIVFLLGSCFKYEDRENLENMVYVSHMLGYLPPKSDKELSDAVCAAFMAAAMDYEKSVIEFITGYIYKEKH